MGISPNNLEENIVTLIFNFPDLSLILTHIGALALIRMYVTNTLCSDLNFVIMDYLINEGYPAAAKKFAAEANIPHPAGDYENIEDRVDIRNAIISGDIQTAIEKINELNPSVSTTPHFSLLLAMIRLCFMHHSYATAFDEI